MSLNDQINHAESSATEAELSEAIETLQVHISYRQELREYGAQGGRLSRPAWADPGRKMGRHWK
jgi:hypothetical protein